MLSESLTHIASHGFSSVTNAIWDTVLRGAVYGINAANPTMFPPPDMAIEAYAQGLVTTTQVSSILNAHGIYAPGAVQGHRWEEGKRAELQKHHELWMNCLGVTYPAFDVERALLMRQRDIISDGDLEAHLIRNKWKDPADREQIKQLMREIPGPGELVHFVLRHGFEPSVIRANRLGEEFPTSAKEWLTKQGLGYTFKIKDPFTGEVADTTWADMYWQTHWVPISPGQAYEMFQRLRPNRLNKYQAFLPGLQPFGLDDVRRWLRINDYPPGVRDQLTALSFLPLGRIDIRRLLQANIIDKAEAIESYRDIGYTLDDATRLVDLALASKEKKAKDYLKRETQSQIAKMYNAGVIDKDEAAVYLYRIEIKDLADLQAFDALPFGQKLAFAGANVSVQYALTNMEIERKRIQLEEYVKEYKSAYVSGRIHRNDIEPNLQLLGMQQWKIDDLFTQWDIAKYGRRREVNASKWVSWAVKGIIGRDELERRLSNLGYDDAAIAHMVAEAMYSLTLATAKQDRATAKTIKDKQAADAKALRALDAARKQTTSRLTQYAKPSQLVKWFVGGLIGLNEMERRMRPQVADDRSYQLMVQDAIQKREAAIQKAAKNPSQPPGGAGGKGASPGTVSGQAVPGNQ